MITRKDRKNPRFNFVVPSTQNNLKSSNLNPKQTGSSPHAIFPEQKNPAYIIQSMRANTHPSGISLNQQEFYMSNNPKSGLIPQQSTPLYFHPTISESAVPRLTTSQLNPIHLLHPAQRPEAIPHQHYPKYPIQKHPYHVAPNLLRPTISTKASIPSPLTLSSFSAHQNVTKPLKIPSTVIRPIPRPPITQPRPSQPTLFKSRLRIQLQEKPSFSPSSTLIISRVPISKCKDPGFARPVNLRLLTNHVTESPAFQHIYQTTEMKLAEAH